MTDAAALMRLARDTYRAAFGHSLSPGDLTAHLRGHLSLSHVARFIRDDTVLIAEEEGCLAGFAHFGRAVLPGSDVDADRELYRLYVRREHQNRGIGRRLMKAVLDHPDLRGAPRVWLDVWEHNHGARRFYERYGFVVEGKVSFAVASGAETSRDLVMALDRWANRATP